MERGGPFPVRPNYVRPRSDCAVFSTTRRAAFAQLFAHHHPADQKPVKTAKVLNGGFDRRTTAPLRHPQKQVRNHRFWQKSPIRARPVVAALVRSRYLETKSVSSLFRPNLVPMIGHRIGQLDFRALSMPELLYFCHPCIRPSIWKTCDWPTCWATSGVRVVGS